MAKARAPTSSAGRVLAVMAVVLGVMLRSAEAETYIVGDATNWNNVKNASFYSTWASSHTFQVNDILVFNFASSQHDVAVVSESNFTSCTTSSPIILYDTSPLNYTLNATGTVYFICTRDSHCSQGQKLSVTVGTASGPTNSSPPPPPPPPSNSATHFMLASCRVMFISMAICLLMMW